MSFFYRKKICFLVQSSSFWILIVACSLLLPAGEGDDRVWWQAKAWLARVVPSPSRFLPSRAYGWRHCYPLARSQQSITFAHRLSKTTLDWKPNPFICVLFEWHYCMDLLHTSSSDALFVWGLQTFWLCCRSLKLDCFCVELPKLQHIVWLVKSPSEMIN